MQALPQRPPAPPGQAAAFHDGLPLCTHHRCAHSASNLATHGAATAEATRSANDKPAVAPGVAVAIASSLLALLMLTAVGLYMWSRYRWLRPHVVEPGRAKDGGQSNMEAAAAAAGAGAETAVRAAALTGLSCDGRPSRSRSPQDRDQHIAHCSRTHHAASHSSGDQSVLHHAYVNSCACLDVCI